MNLIELPFVKMSTDAVTPTRATAGSVGLDFYSPANYVIPPHSQLLIPTQIKIRIPLGHYGRIASKSGLAILHQLHVGAGVIDPALYRRNYGLVNQYCFTCTSYH